jgi:hypothetical protein
MMRKAFFCVFPIICLLVGCGGTICADGGFEYDLEFDLVDSSGELVPDVKVLVWGYPAGSPADENIPSNALDQSDALGHVSTSASSGLAWGGCFSSNVWASYTPPIPSNPEILYLWVEDATGLWTEYELQVKEENIIERAPAQLKIDLGEITIATSQPE